MSSPEAPAFAVDPPAPPERGVIVLACLGVPAAKLLAAITPALVPWRPWPGYTTRLIAEGAAGSISAWSPPAKFTAVAVQHPSAVVSRDGRHRDAELIERAAGGL